MNYIVKISTRLLLVCGIAVALQHCQSEDDDPDVEDPALSILGISPETGTAGTVVTITGTGFSANAADNKVELKGKMCPVTNASATQLMISIPADAATGNVRVTVKGQSVESARPFTYTGGPTGNESCVPDATFGENGLAITEVEGVTTGDFTFVHNNVVQPDGKIIVIGEYSSGTRPFAVLRYNANGTLDTSWGGDGQVITNFNTSGVTYDFARPYAIALQADGKVVVVGDARQTNHPEAFAIARYTSDGTLDNTFSDDGMVVYTPPAATNGAGALGVAIQTDGKIVLSGHATMFGASRACVARLLSNGMPDDSFNGGSVELQFGENEYHMLTAVKVQPDGKIVASGFAEKGFKTTATVVRLNPDGTLDASFGSGGKVVTQVGTSQNKPSQSILQSDGKILISGYSQNETGATAPVGTMIRYNTDGTLDQSFGTGGSVRDVNSGIVNGLVVLSDGKIVTCGGSFLSRYNTDGSFDNTLCEGKHFVRNSDLKISAEAIAVQPDNAVIVSGEYVSTTPAGKKDQRFYSARHKM